MPPSNPKAELSRERIEELKLWRSGDLIVANHDLFTCQLRVRQTIAALIASRAQALELLREARANLLNMVASHESGRFGVGAVVDAVAYTEKLDTFLKDQNQ